MVVAVTCPAPIANLTLKIVPLYSWGYSAISLPETNETIIAKTVVRANFSPFSKVKSIPVSEPLSPNLSGALQDCKNSTANPEKTLQLQRPA